MISIRRYRKGDEGGIVRLTKLVFPNFYFNVRQWQWRHTNGKSRIFVALDDKNTIIGHWAYLERSFISRTKKYKSGLTLAAMIHPGWQGKGVFSRIAKILFDNARSEKIDFLYCFPNDISLPVHLHYGFLYVKPYHIYKKKVTRGLRTERGIVFTEKKAYKQVNQQHISPLTVQLDKNSQEYIEWRYFKKPGGRYLFYEMSKDGNTIGYIVFKAYYRQDHKHIQLIDVSVTHNLSEDDFGDSIYDFWQFLANKNTATLLSTWQQNLEVVEDQMIGKYHFQREKDKIFHLAIKGIRLNARSIKYLQARNWDIKMGDTEIF